MAIVRPDRIKDSSYIVEGTNKTLVRTFAVKDCSDNPDGILREAVAAVATYGVTYGSAHPEDADMICKKIEAYPLGGHRNAWVKATYIATYIQPPSVGVNYWKQYEAGLSNEITDSSYTGTPIQVTYKPHTGAAGDNVSAITKSLPAGGTVSVLKPYLKIHITKNKKTAATALSNVSPYIGMVNTDSFDGFAAGKCLCMSATASTSDGVNYTIDYDIMYRPQGWKAYASYVLPTGQRPYNAYNAYLADPANVATKNNGFSEITIYGTVAFSGILT